MGKQGKPRGQAVALATAGGGGDIVVVRTHALSRMYLRFHVALLILWSFCCGLLVNKALLLAGVHWMVVRYPLALLVGYGAFFVGVRLWLAYVGAAPLRDETKQAARADDGRAADSGVDLTNVADVVDLGRCASPSGFRAGGGNFGGGGASASFGSASESSLAAPRFAASGARGGFFSTKSGGSGAGGFALDLGDGDGWLVILLLMLAAAFLFSVFGAVLYVVYAAPAMLADVAFSAMLAGGLVKSSRRWRDACWKTELFRATWAPFTIVFVLAVLTAGLALHLFPGARTFSELIHAAMAYLG